MFGGVVVGGVREFRVAREEERVDLGGEVEEHFVDAGFLDALDWWGWQDVLDDGEDAPGFEPVRVERDLVGLDVREAVIAILPLALALTPGGHMLADELRADLFRFGDVGVAVETEFAGGVVDRDETLPLLDGEGLGWRESEADLLALRVEGVEVDVGYAAERAVRGGLREEG